MAVIAVFVRLRVFPSPDLSDRRPWSSFRLVTRVLICCLTFCSNIFTRRSCTGMGLKDVSETENIEVLTGYIFIHKVV